jgi:hypothetical protein
MWGPSFSNECLEVPCSFARLPALSGVRCQFSTQALIALAFAYTGQGRVFLSLGEDLPLKYLVAGNAVAALVFARILARRVVPDQATDPDSDDRIRWMALRHGSIVVGLMAAFHRGVVIETFVSGADCRISREPQFRIDTPRPELSC